MLIPLDAVNEVHALSNTKLGVNVIGAFLNSEDTAIDSEVFTIVPSKVASDGLWINPYYSTTGFCIYKDAAITFESTQTIYSITVTFSGKAYLGRQTIYANGAELVENVEEELVYSYVINGNSFTIANESEESYLYFKNIEIVYATPTAEGGENEEQVPTVPADYSINFTDGSVTTSDAGTTVTANFKTAETFENGKFVLTSSSSNMLVESGKGLKFQQVDASISFTLEEAASVTILLYSSDDTRTFVFASTAEGWEEDTIARKDTEVSNNGSITYASNVITLTYETLAAGTYTISNSGKYTLYIQSISVNYPGN